MPIRLDQSQTPETIFLEGAIDISSAAELKRALIEAVDSRIGFLVSLARTTALDVTTLQLLHAAEREAETSGIGFRIVGPLSGEILASFRDVDLQPPLICEETKPGKRGSLVSTVGNVDSFKQGFLDEAREIVIELETALLELGEARSNTQLTGQVFRGLHTLKGSGSMFGFDKLAAFLHDLETAFDAVRNGRLAVTPELIDLTLAALDQVKAMLEEGSCTITTVPSACAEILAGVRNLIGFSESRTKEEETNQPSSPVKTALQEWHIHFAPGPDFMRSGADPLLLFRELKQLGALSVQASMAFLPPLRELDPERCYVSWDATLTAATDRDGIKDVFIFVEDQCELTIEPVDIVPSPAAASPALPCAEKRSASTGRREYEKQDNAASNIRVPAAKLDQYVDLVGELVTVQARLSEIAVRRDDPDVLAVSEEVERLTAALRDNSMNIRMLPDSWNLRKISAGWSTTSARDLDKDVELTIEGADTELDKTVIDQLSDPLMHLIRNSMDHGIEAHEVRAARGKRQHCKYSSFRKAFGCQRTHFRLR